MTSTIPTTPFKKPPFFYEEVEGLHADHLRYIDGERDDIWTLAKIRIIGTDGALIFAADHRCDPA